MALLPFEIGEGKAVKLMGRAHLSPRIQFIQMPMLPKPFQPISFNSGAELSSCY